MWKDLIEKLNKSGRTWAYPSVGESYRWAELFCEECGTSLGVHDIVTTNMETTKYCDKCAQKYIKRVPVTLSCGTLN